LGVLGQKLKAEREKRKITLEEVSVATKIGLRMLHALEEEKFDLLPGGIFNKNFVRIYAHYLGLNEQQAIADYMAAAGPAPEPVPEDQELRAIADRKAREHQQSQSAGVPWGTVSVLLLVIALGMSLWGFHSRDRAVATSDDRPDRPVASTLPQDSPVPPTENHTLQEAKLNVDTAPSAVNVASVETVPGSRSLTENERAIPDATGSAPRAAGSESDRVSGRTFSVSVAARDNSWLTLTVDGNVLHHGMFSATSQKTLEAQKEIIVKAGNIGALEISFNGKKLAPLGGDGEVRVLTFHANGLEAQ
jgi:cytoskeletal protein RodZ